MAQLFANSGDPDQMPQNAASDLGLHFLPIIPLWDSRLQWVNVLKFHIPKFLEYACTNSADPNQTSPKGATSQCLHPLPFQ